MGFVSEIKIDRYHRSYIRLCPNDSAATTDFSFFNVESKGLDYFIRKYSYRFPPSGGATQPQLMWESDHVTANDFGGNERFRPCEPYIYSDGTVILGFDQGWSGQLGGVVIFNPDGTIRDQLLHSNPESQGFWDAGILSVRGRNNDSRILVSQQFRIGLLVDEDLTTKLQQFGTQGATDQRFYIWNRNNRVFSHVTGPGLYELDLSDGSVIRQINVESLFGPNHIIRDFSETLDGRIAVTVWNQANSSTGRVVIFNEDLTIYNQIIAGTDDTFVVDESAEVAVDSAGKVYITHNTGGIYRLDPTTKQVDYHLTWGGWSLGDRSPKSLHVDLFGNIIISAGTGSDPRHVLVIDPNGNLKIEFSMQDDTDSDEFWDTGIHFTNWIQYV